MYAYIYIGSGDDSDVRHVCEAHIYICIYMYIYIYRYIHTFVHIYI